MKVAGAKRVGVQQGLYYLLGCAVANKTTSEPNDLVEAMSLVLNQSNATSRAHMALDEYRAFGNVKAAGAMSWFSSMAEVAMKNIASRVLDSTSTKDWQAVANALHRKAGGCGCNDLVSSVVTRPVPDLVDTEPDNELVAQFGNAGRQLFVLASEARHYSRFEPATAALMKLITIESFSWTQQLAIRASLMVHLSIKKGHRQAAEMCMLPQVAVKELEAAEPSLCCALSDKLRSFRFRRLVKNKEYRKVIVGQWLPRSPYWKALYRAANAYDYLVLACKTFESDPSVDIDLAERRFKKALLKHNLSMRQARIFSKFLKSMEWIFNYHYQKFGTSY